MSKLLELEMRMREAIAARDEGRIEDALAACRAVLAIAPNHVEGNKLIVALSALGSGHSTHDATPLPRPLAHHVADPTEPPTLTGEELARHVDADVPYKTRRVPLLTQEELDGAITPAPLPGDDEDPEDSAVTYDRVLEEEHTDQLDLRGRGGRRRGGDGKVSPFLAPLPEDVRPTVMQRFTHKVVAAGAYVIRRGENQHPLVLVHKGRLDVRVERANGVPVQLASLTAGEYIGEGALLERKPAPAHVIAATDAEILLLAPKDFYEIAAAYPALWAELKDSAERRRREQDNKLRGR